VVAERACIGWERERESEITGWESVRESRGWERE